MTRPTFSALVTAHKDSPMPMLLGLGRQTVRPTIALVGLSEFPQPWFVPSLGFPTVFMESPDEHDFGYRKRNRYVPLIVTDFVGFFSHDDSYDSDYIEKMLDALVTTSASAVYCGWDDGPGTMGEQVGRECEFRGRSSTLGNFFVRTSLLKEIGGFPAPDGSTQYPNEGFRDAALIDAIRARVSSVARVNTVMYHHNKPYSEAIRPSVWGRRS